MRSKSTLKSLFLACPVASGENFSENCVSPRTLRQAFFNLVAMKSKDENKPWLLQIRITSLLNAGYFRKMGNKAKQ